MKLFMLIILFPLLLSAAETEALWLYPGESYPFTVDSLREIRNIEITCTDAGGDADLELIINNISIAKYDVITPECGSQECTVITVPVNAIISSDRDATAEIRIGSDLAKISRLKVNYAGEKVRFVNPQFNRWFEQNQEARFYLGFGKKISQITVTWYDEGRATQGCFYVGYIPYGGFQKIPDYSFLMGTNIKPANCVTPQFGDTPVGSFKFILGKAYLGSVMVFYDYSYSNQL